QTEIHPETIEASPPPESKLLGLDCHHSECASRNPSTNGRERSTRDDLVSAFAICPRRWILDSAAQKQLPTRPTPPFPARPPPGLLAVVRSLPRNVPGQSLSLVDNGLPASAAETFHSPEAFGGLHDPRPTGWQESPATSASASHMGYAASIRTARAVG